MMITRQSTCSQRSGNRLTSRQTTGASSAAAARFCSSSVCPILPAKRCLPKVVTKRALTVRAAQAASNKTSKVIKKVVGALPIVVLLGLALVPVCMTLASALKFGAASKTYQGVGNYYDAGIPIAVKAAAACLGAIFGFIHDVGVLLLSVVTSSWVFWPVLVIGFAAILFRD